MSVSRCLKGAADLSLELSRLHELEETVSALLAGLERYLGFPHTLLMMLDEGGDRLFTIATRGFSPSGVGSEQQLGEGLWGKVAERRLPVRINNLGLELVYGRQLRLFAAEAGDERVTREIVLPGLARLGSVLAVPLLARGEVVGVLGAQSPESMAFDDAAEQALAILAVVAGQKLAMPRDDDEDAAEATSLESTARGGATSLRRVQYYRADDSVFVDHDYVIKGLSGRILWKLLREHQDGRREFSNKELRLDPSLELSPYRDNLDSRLIMLRRRLEEKSCGIRIDKRGRGRFALVVSAAVELVAT